MKSKDIRKDCKGPKKAKSDLDNKVEVQDVTMPVEDARYQIMYGKNHKATITILSGPNKNKTTVYNGRTKEWTGTAIPVEIQKTIERYYS